MAMCAAVVAAALLRFEPVSAQSPREPRVLAARSLTELRAHDGRVTRMMRGGDLRVRERLAENFTAWVDAVEGCFRAAAPRFREATDFRGLAELALNVMEGGVMQSRTYRDVAHFDRAVAQFHIAVDAMRLRETAA